MKRRFMARTVASGAVLAACSVVGVPQAQAQSHTQAVRFAPAANASSTSAAGYVLANPPTPASTSANARFKVPTLTCPSTGTYGIALGAFISTNLEPIGAEVTAKCSSGAAVYAAVLVPPGVSALWTPAPGDVIRTQVTTSATVTGVVITDITQKQRISFIDHAGGEISSAILVGMHALVSSRNTQLPVPPFGTERFAAGRINGGSPLASGAVAESMRTSTRVLQIHTGVLNSTGTAWREGFRHS